MIEVSYPLESGFYPTHLLLTIFICALFGLGLATKWNYDRIKEKQKSKLTRTSVKVSTDSESTKVEGTRIEGTAAEGHKKMTLFELATSDLNSYQLLEKLKNFEPIFKKIFSDIITDLKYSPPKRELSDYIAIIGLVITLMLFIANPLFNNPFLNYQVKEYNNSIQISITNLGLKTANNLLLSMTSNNDTTFSDFDIKPYLPEDQINSSVPNHSENWFLSLKTLPPLSFTSINLFFKTTNNDTEIVTYLRSDETVGHFNVYGIILYYVVLIIFFGIFAFLFWFRPTARELLVIFMGFGLIIIMGIAYIWYEVGFKS